MAAPEFVPLKPTDAPRAYSSNPRRPESWMPTRPGEVVDTGQPRDTRLGNQGPDQGYALKLLHLFDGKLHLTDGEEREDADAGCIGVALKRASIFGRAPIVHDLTVAFTIWGFLDEKPAAGLLQLRKHLFAEVRNPHHYAEQREIVDSVPESTLRMSHLDITSAHEGDWRGLLDL